jgi:predicted nuclease with TOPRIM domain
MIVFNHSTVPQPPVERPPNASDQEYIGLLEQRNMCYSERIAGLHGFVNALSEQRAQLFDEVQHWQNEFGRLTDENIRLKEQLEAVQQLKATPQPTGVDTCLSLRALNTALEHSYTSRHMAELAGKIEQLQKRNDELEKNFLKVNAFRAWELINEFLVLQNHPLVLNREVLEQNFGQIATLGHWLAAIVGCTWVVANNILARFLPVIANVAQVQHEDAEAMDSEESEVSEESEDEL